MVFRQAPKQPSSGSRQLLSLMAKQIRRVVTTAGRMVERAFDVVISGLALLGLAVPFAVISVAVALDDGSRVFLVKREASTAKGA